MELLKKIFKKKQLAEPTEKIIQKNLLEKYEIIRNTYTANDHLYEFIDLMNFHVNRAISKLNSGDIYFRMFGDKTWQVVKLIVREVNKLRRLRSDYDRTYYTSRLLVQLCELKSCILDDLHNIKK